MYIKETFFSLTRSIVSQTPLSDLDSWMPSDNQPVGWKVPQRSSMLFPAGLVVYLPLCKIWVSWDYEIPNWMESHKIHVPNHQAAAMSPIKTYQNSDCPLPRLMNDDERVMLLRRQKIALEVSRMLRPHPGLVAAWAPQRDHGHLNPYWKMDGFVHFVLFVYHIYIIYIYISYTYKYAIW